MPAVVNPDGIPQIEISVEMLRLNAEHLKAIGRSVQSAGGDIDGTWQSLRASYMAPGDGALFGATALVQETGESANTRLEITGNALTYYADAVEPLQRELQSLKARAVKLRGEAGANEDWDEDDRMVAEHVAIGYGVNSAMAQWATAQRDCANRIRDAAGLGADLWVEDNADGNATSGEFGFSKAKLDELYKESDSGLPWGKWTEVDDGVVMEFLEGVGEVGWEAIDGVGTLVGFHGLDAMGDAWVNLGKFASTPFTIGWNSMVELAGEDDLKVGLSAQDLVQVGKDLVAWDEWDDNAAGAAGKTTANVAALVFGPKVGAITKVGAAKAVLSMGEMFPTVASAATKIGKTFDFQLANPTFAVPELPSGSSTPSFPNPAPVAVLDSGAKLPAFGWSPSGSKPNGAGNPSSPAPVQQGWQGGNGSLLPSSSGSTPPGSWLTEETPRQSIVPPPAADWRTPAGAPGSQGPGGPPPVTGRPPPGSWFEDDATEPIGAPTGATPPSALVYEAAPTTPFGQQAWRPTPAVHQDQTYPQPGSFGPTDQPIVTDPASVDSTSITDSIAPDGFNQSGHVASGDHDTAPGGWAGEPDPASQSGEVALPGPIRTPLSGHPVVDVDLRSTAMHPVDLAAFDAKNGAVVWRETNELLYRAENRGEEIFTTGFAPLNPNNLDLVSYVRHSLPSDFVGTTMNPNYFEDSAGLNFFDIDAPGGIDVNRTLPRNIHNHEQEIAMIGGIRPERIRGFWRIEWDSQTRAGVLGQYVGNPNYVP